MKKTSNRIILLIIAILLLFPIQVLALEIDELSETNIMITNNDENNSSPSEEITNVTKDVNNSNSYESQDENPLNEEKNLANDNDTLEEKETTENKENGLVEQEKTVNPDSIDSNELENIKMFLPKYDVYVLLEDKTYEMNIPKVYPSENSDTVINKLSWTSSNKEVGIVSSTGVVTLQKVGETTITASLSNAISKSYVLHVIDNTEETIDEPEDIILEQNSYTIEVGEYAQILYKYAPEKVINPKSHIYMSREIENEDIVNVDNTDFYVVKGVKAGTTTLTLKLYNSTSNDHIISKTIEIIVIDKEAIKQEDVEEKQTGMIEPNLEEQPNTNQILLSNNIIDNKQTNVVYTIKKVNNKKTSEVEKTTDDTTPEKTNKNKEKTSSKEKEAKQEKETKEEKTENKNEKKQNISPEKKPLIALLIVFCLFILVLFYVLISNKY